MKIALVCGSPKGPKSSSSIVLSRLRELLGAQHDYTEVYIPSLTIPRDKLKEMTSYDVIILAFPLYVDGIPGHLLASLIEYEPMLKTQQSLYSVINCGFYEGEQCRIAAEMLRHWAKRAGIENKGTLGIGTGGMLSMDDALRRKGTTTSIRRALEELKTQINTQQAFDFVATQAGIPWLAYKWGAHIGWYASRKRNGLKRKDLKRQFTDITEIPALKDNSSEQEL